MKPLLVLITAFLISAGVIRLVTDAWEWQLAARISMAAMLVFTAIGHFAFTKGMALMLPDFIPAKDAVIRGTGIIEGAAAIGLCVPQLTRMTGWLLILFFVLIMPANIYAARKRVDYQKGNYTGPGAQYLWFRVPLQLLFIAWVYWAAISG